jgi:hypothetical protein
VTLEQVSKIPTHEIVRASIDADGHLFLVCSGSRKPRGSTDRQLIVHRSVDGSWNDRVIESASGRPFVQPGPDGGLLVIDEHSRRSLSGDAQANAKIYDADGAKVHCFVAGDGINDVQTTHDGVWISYSDLGTTGDFGMFGWGRLSPEIWVDPVGYDGLLRFTWEGRSEISVVPPTPGLPIIDCLALNVDDEDVWAYAYPGYTLLHIAVGGEVLARSGIGLPVTALAVSAPHVLLARAILGQRIRAWRANLGPAGLNDLEEVRLKLEHEGGGPIRQLIARGAALYALTDDAWYRAQAGATS